MGVAEGDRFAVAGPPGAGRIIDMRWPDDQAFRQNGLAVSLAVKDRIAAVLDIQGAVATYSVNPNNGWNANINGRSGATIGSVNPNAPNGLQYSFHPMVAQIGRRGVGVASPPPNLAGSDQLLAYRAIMIASFVNPAGAIGAAVDNGLELCTAGGVTIDDGLICQKGTPGIGFRVHDTQSVEAIIRVTQAGALTRVPLLTAANNYQPGDWHAYEIRIIGAQGAAEAQAKWLIDGRVVHTRLWGVGTMPETNANYSGFKVNIASTGGTQFGLTVSQLDWHASKSEDGLI